MKKGIIIAASVLVIAASAIAALAITGVIFKKIEVPEDMTVIEKEKDRDLKILNFTDVQLSNSDWTSKNDCYRTATETIKALIESEKPDLITITGDIAYNGEYISYQNFADYMDSFKIPWAPIMGNHDNQSDAAAVNKAADIFIASEYSIYKKGPEEFGNGNYVAVIREGNSIIEGLIFADTHDRGYYNDENGIRQDSWGYLTKPQTDWYKEQVGRLSELDCKDSTLLIHIPIYAYNDAFKAAFVGDDPKAVEPEDSADEELWNEGYRDSFGVKYEEICSFGQDDGVFAAIKELGHTKNIICGHDHVNNFSVVYDGVRFTYGTKTGSGCYWDARINGGTVITVGSEGVTGIRQVYYDTTK